MKIVCDPIKRAINLDKHGLDFNELTFEFFDSAVIVPAKNRRLKAINFFKDGTITVVFFRLGREGLAVISMRPASKKERQLLV